MSKYIIDTKDNNISKSYIFSVLDNELGVNVVDVKDINESIDEEKLDNLSIDEIVHFLQDNYGIVDTDYPYNAETLDAFKKMFKAGYRKAMEGK